MTAIGMRVGDFELLGRLGRGGQGEVFLAWPWQRSPARYVTRLWLQTTQRVGSLGHADALQWRLAALKLAHPHARDSLHDEHAHLAAPEAGHTHLPRLYGRRFPGLAPDLGLAPCGRPYLALAYEPGASLERTLRHRGSPPPPTWSARVTAQVASALAHLHARGIVHHDVRPANVIVREGRAGQPHCTLIDLGAAETPGAPRRRAIYGTVGYLPPERSRPNSEPATPHVDVYGLGVLLRVLIAGAEVSRPLAALAADATADDLGARRAAIPDMAAMLQRLADLPEAR